MTEYFFDSFEDLFASRTWNSDQIYKKYKLFNLWSSIRVSKLYRRLVCSRELLIAVLSSDCMHIHWRLVRRKFILHRSFWITIFDYGLWKDSGHAAWCRVECRVTIDLPLLGNVVFWWQFLGPYRSGFRSKWWTFLNSILCNSFGTFMTEPKVDQFDLEILVEEYIISFDVSVRYSFFMEVVYSCDNWFENDFGLGFIEFSRGTISDVLL